MNKEQIAKLHAEAQHDLLAGAKAKNMDLQDIIALCQAAGHSLSAQDEVLTDHDIYVIIRDARNAWNKDADEHNQWEELSDLEKCALVIRRAAAAPSPAVAVEPVGYEYRAVANNLPESRRNGWVRCTKAAYESYKANPFINNVRWEVRELYATPSPSLAVRDGVEDPMDWPLPCDVKVGHGTHRKGCTLGSLVARMKVLYDMVQDTQPRLTDEQRDIMQKYFGAKPNADCSGEPANCPDNEGHGCACDPMNKAAMREQRP